MGKNSIIIMKSTGTNNIYHIIMKGYHFSTRYCVLFRYTLYRFLYHVHSVFTGDVATVDVTSLTISSIILRHSFSLVRDVTASVAMVAVVTHGWITARDMRKGILKSCVQTSGVYSNYDKILSFYNNIRA